MPQHNGSSLLLAALHLHYGDAIHATRLAMGGEKANELYCHLEKAAAILGAALETQRNDSSKDLAAI